MVSDEDVAYIIEIGTRKRKFWNAIPKSGVNFGIIVQKCCVCQIKSVSLQRNNQPLLGYGNR